MDAVTAVALRAAQGDRVALAEFVGETQAGIWRLCSHLVDPASADDLTQEVYLRALPALDRFRGESSARTWILAIARHVCMDELRRRSRGRALVQRILSRSRPDDRLGPDQAGEVAIEALLAGLDPNRREAFVLTQVLGLSYAETATICGCELGTVRSRVARARADLVEALVAGADDTGTSSG
jgi:RNA polymerase sigma-70 factor, ECF subfamily